MKSASVIIPARNRADLLPHVLAALARQTVPASPFEVVVINDGSTDDTAAVVRKARWPFRLVYVELVRRGGFCPARPRNHGLYAATGDLAIFLDADVLAFPDLIEQHLGAYRGTKRLQAVIGYTYAYAWAASDRLPETLNPPPPECFLEELPRLLAGDEARWRDGREPIYAGTRDLAEHPAPWQMYWTNNVSVPRSLALEIGGFDEQFVGWGMEDLEFAYRLHQHGVPIRLVRGARAAHYPHPIPDLADRMAQLRRNRRRFIAKHAEPRLELRLWDPRACEPAWREASPHLAVPPEYPLPVTEAAAAVVDRLRSELFPPGPLLLCGAFHPDPLQRWQPAACCNPFGVRSAECGAMSSAECGVRNAEWGVAAASSVTRHPSSGGDGPLHTTEDASRIMDYGSRITDHASRITDHGSPVTGHWSPVTGHCLPLLGLFTPWEDGSFAGAVVWDYWRWLPPAALDGLVEEMRRVAGCVALLAVETALGASEYRAALRDEEDAGACALPAGGVWHTLHAGPVIAFLAESPPEAPPRAERCDGTPCIVASR